MPDHAARTGFACHGASHRDPHRRVRIHRRPVDQAGHRPQNFYMLGSMGLAFPIALGVALAQPQRRVFALEGDGSLLMQLGSLSTIASLAPKNLTMVVMDNGVHQITGAQPTPAAAVSDIVAIAVASGLGNSAWAADEEDFERLIDQSMS